VRIHVHSPAVASVAKGAATLAVSAACLTMLFAGQDVMRRVMTGGSAEWGQSIALSGIDWTLWALLCPVVLGIGRRYRLDDRAHRVRNLGVWIGLALASCLFHGSVTGIVLRESHLLGGVVPPAALQSPRFLAMWVSVSWSYNLMIFGMVAGALHALFYYRDLRARDATQTELETRLARAELNVLRMQLQPHFLFNALHTISSLMASDVTGARRVIAALGALLRVSIDHTASQEVPLQDELAFVDRYVEIQLARFRQRLTVQMRVDSDVLTAIVPSLVLQPLIENAIRHGVERSIRGGHVSVRASRVGSQLVLTVSDDASSHDGDAAWRSPAPAGVGLTNIALRLAQLYGASHEFHAGRNELGEFEVRMALPFRTAPDALIGAVS
jgi:two-component system, LytTR family, sensor kinase